MVTDIDWRALRFRGSDGLTHYAYTANGGRCRTSAARADLCGTVGVVTCLQCVADRARPRPLHLRLPRWMEHVPQRPGNNAA